ncbi:hypothetical protein SAMN04488134_108119 [Amphibacillus marinus]|uniref:D-glucuronyl C5-epimerase C-terminus n=2 Tax=Amphibacillus marinus TaxID=872970 RepID=A0A1H8QCF1_9BACI|nr:hypothetical protein SAMN04488134_108119 [Amphibacillus marinus]
MYAYNKLKIRLGLIIFTCFLAGCDQDMKTSKDLNLDKEVLRVSLYNEASPTDYQLIDWQDRALAFDRLIFDQEAEGNYLPLIWDDRQYNSFGLPAYVGDGRLHNDGAQEAVTNIAAIVSASLLGEDKSEGEDYVSQLSAFFSEEEGIILNNPAGSSETTSMWYLLYPTILFAHASDLYESNDLLREQLLTAIESWYQAYLVMYDNGNPDFDYTGFNFNTNEPYRNDVWTEPDSAVGIGLLMYYGYEMTEETKYLDAAINTMDYMENYFGSPLYEALMYFGPYLAAKLNAYHGTTYDIAGFMDDNFNASSIPRGGWGSIIGQWGNYEMNGLFGSATDGGGFAFSMNTFAGAGAIVPVAAYDARFARSIGQWMLHLASNSRYYFATETNDENQSCTYFNNDCADIEDSIKYAIPYEGIRKDSNGRTPWFGGDPTVYGWAETDFSLYSGAHTGILASLITATNIEQILRLDLNATRFFEDENYPTSLFYNPYQEEKELIYEVTSAGEVNLFNTLTNEVIVSNVNDSVAVEIEADRALVIVELPSDAEVIKEDGGYYVSNQLISTELIAVAVSGIEENESVSGKITLDVEVVANYETEIAEITLELDEHTLIFNENEAVTFTTKDYRSGPKRMRVGIETTDGKTDHTYLRMQFK